MVRVLKNTALQDSIPYTMLSETIDIKAVICSQGRIKALVGPRHFYDICGAKIF